MLIFMGIKDNRVKVFDTDDFSVDTASVEVISDCLLKGITIKGLYLNKNHDLVTHWKENRLIYKDSEIAVVINQKEDLDCVNSIKVYCKGCDLPSYNIGYNRWISHGNDSVSPEVEKLTSNVYAVNLFGTKIGISICFVFLNGIVKPIYRDMEYVSKDTKLICDGINIKRIMR